MATAQVTANTAPQVLFSTPRHVKGKPRAVNIDNKTTFTATVRIQDVFTPDPSNKVPSPTEKTLERLQVTVPKQTFLPVDRDALERVEILGEAKAIADITDTDCVITVAYDFE